MAFQLAQAFVEFGVKGTGSVESAIGRIKGMLGDLQKGGGGLASTIASPIATGIIEGISIGLATLPFAIERELKLTRMKIQTGSMAGAMQLSRGLKDIFTGTGIESGEYTGAATEMVAKGASVDRVLSQMQLLADISIKTGTSLGGMAEAMARVEISGRVTGRTLQAMKPVAEELAREYHTSTEMIFEMAESGRIKFAELQHAVEKLGAASAGSARAMQQTTGGAWDKWVESMGNFMAAIGEVFSSSVGLKDILMEAAEGMVYFADSVRAFSDYIHGLADEYEDMIYQLTLGLSGRSMAESRAIAAANASGGPIFSAPMSGGAGGGGYGTVGLAELATKMQSEADTKLVDLAELQLAEQQKTNQLLGGKFTGSYGGEATW